MKNVNLYNQDGSLHPEAQFLLSIDLKSFSTKKEKKAARKLLDEFRAKLSIEDVKEFQRLKKCIRSKKWIAENPEKAKENNAKWRAENPDYPAIWRAENPDYNANWYAENTEKVKQDNAKWRAENPEKKKAQNAKWRAENPEKQKVINANWYAENAEKLNQDSAKRYAENPEKKKAQNAKWKAENPKKLKEHQRKQRSRPENKLRSAVSMAFKKIGQNKPTDTLALLGCTWEEAKAHFESLFLEGMTWENHGRGEGKWQIDHIRPVASFKGASEEELKQMNHISNLQPLWAIDNIKKGDKWEENDTLKY